MTTIYLNSEGVDQAALAEAIEQWLARSPDNTAALLAQHAGINARGIWQLRNLKRPEVTLDWADRLTLAMDIPLSEVAPTRDDGAPDDGGARLGKHLNRHMRCITAGDLKLAYELHWRGVPLNRIARAWQRSGRVTYKSEEVASSSMWQAFKARGWLCRDRIEMVRVASTKHGRAGRAQARAYGPDYAAYRRAQRRRAGYVQDRPCASPNKSGDPCKRWALAGKQHCVAHDPERVEQRQRIMDAAWTASRARMLRWGDLRPRVDCAIVEHGRPALVRASGISSTVLGRMLRYGEEQPIKPETWTKLEQGIERLRSEPERFTSRS